MEVIEKKEIVHDHSRKEYASKGVAGAGLGLGIAGTALALFGGGLGGGRGLFGGGAVVDHSEQPSAFQAWEKACNAEMADQKAVYELAMTTAHDRYTDRSQIDSELFGLYKTQLTADFDLYKSQRDGFDILANRIGKLETATAVQAAIEPWKSQVTKMEINNVASMVNLEAERRNCADQKLVTYMNGTFYPISVADNDVNTTATARTTYNPLSGGVVTVDVV